MATQQLSFFERRLVAWGALSSACARGHWDFFVEQFGGLKVFGGEIFTEALKLTLTART